MQLAGLEIGSWADLLSGAATTLGILLSLYWNYLNVRMKIFINAKDVRFNVSGTYRTTGKILIRAYNKSNKPFVIDSVGFQVIKVNNKKRKKLYLSFTAIDHNPEKDAVIQEYSDGKFNTTVKELIDMLNFVSAIDKDDENEVLLVPYIKGPVNKVFVGKTKMLINTKTFAINNGSYITMDQE